MIRYDTLPKVDLLRHVKRSLCLFGWKLSTFPGKRFDYRGKRYRYFGHVYNQTWKNERVVEVPIALDLLRASAGKRVLEIGNVLSHYAPVRHDILDKYEEADGVINQDVVLFEPRAPYDLILSISTIEHIGQDDLPQEPGKVVRAIEKIMGMLAPGGQFFMTVPTGYNAALDDFLKSPSHPFQEQHFLRRISFENQWSETKAEEAFSCAYDRPFPYANALVIAHAHRR